MISNAYAKAYTEVLEIFKYFPEEEYLKLPKEKIEFYESNRDKAYNFTINPEIDLSKQNISKEARAIIVTIFRDYYATEEQKKVINDILELNQRKDEEEKRRKYNPEDIFKNNTNLENKNTIQIEKDNNKIENKINLKSDSSDNIQLIEYKTSFFEKFKNFLYHILHIN